MMILLLIRFDKTILLSARHEINWLEKKFRVLVTKLMAIVKSSQWVATI